MCKGTLKEILQRISQQVDHIQIQVDEIMRQTELGQKEFVGMEGLANIAGIPLSTAYQISCKNILPKFRIGKRILFKRKDVFEMIEKSRVASESETKEQVINEVMLEDHHG